MSPDTLAKMGRQPDTELRFRHLLAARALALGPDDYDTHLSRERLGNTVWLLGRLDEAIQLKRAAWDGTKRIVGPTHIVPMQQFESLWWLLRQKGDIAALHKTYECGLREILDSLPALDARSNAASGQHSANM